VRRGLRECAEAQRIADQRRVAEAVEGVYDGATALVSPLLATLFEATGQESRAAPYRHRAQTLASVEVLRWQIVLLETLETGGQAEPSDRYRLFALHLDLSRRLREEGRGEEGYLQAERAYTMAHTWNDPVREAEALNLMGLNLHAQGRYGAAEPLYERALALREQALGADHPDTAASLNNLAGCYHAQGRYAAAEPLYQRALAIRERVLGADHPDTATVRENYTCLLQSMQLRDRRRDHPS